MAKKIDESQLHPKELYDLFVKYAVNYFCGVPDSSLSSFGFYLEDHSKSRHDIAINEGNAVAMAIGYYLANSEVPLVYMQNSGLGNAINPIVSLADPLIMGIPMILLIGWRGQPGKKDEPQHQKQGLITQDLLDTLGIPHLILSRNPQEVSKQVHRAVSETLQSKRPFALIVESDTFERYARIDEAVNNYQLSREDSIELITKSLGDLDVVVATTGKTGRELFEHRDKVKQTHKKDLLIIGGMGHASSIAGSIAQWKPKRKVYCIDGDGALLMHMGSLPLLAGKNLKNFYHIVINNGSHESVGGQSTVGFEIDIPAIAKAAGYAYAYRTITSGELKDILKTIRKLDGPILVEVRVNTASRTNLARPTIHPSENKESFMSFLEED